MARYPTSLWRPLPADHYSFRPANANVDLVVLHITTGPSDIPGLPKTEPHAESAIQTFFNSRYPNRISTHFVVDRDGSVTQLVDTEFEAWHASQVNSHSIGIETSASADGLFPAIDAQYAALAKLVKWCCNLIGAPVNRDHVRSHNEASPADHHVKCCTGGLDPDKVVVLAVAAT